MWPSELEEKRLFAREWLKNSDPFKAAIAAFGMENVGKCLKISQEWPTDNDVLSIRAELVAEEGEETFLPTKADLAKRILDVADVHQHPDHKLKALRLFAEVMGFIIKPDTSNAVTGKGVVAVPMTEVEMKL